MSGALDIPVSINHGMNSKMEVTQNEKCMKMIGLGLSDIKMHDANCTHHQSFKACLLKKETFGAGLIKVRKQSTVPLLSLTFVGPPDYVAGTITCPLPPPNPPGSAVMALDSTQPSLMCPGKKAKYVCNAGGINVRLVIRPLIYSFEWDLQHCVYRIIQRGPALKHHARVTNPMTNRILLIGLSVLTGWTAKSRKLIQPS